MFNVKFVMFQNENNSYVNFFVKKKPNFIGKRKKTHTYTFNGTKIKVILTKS